MSKEELASQLAAMQAEYKTISKNATVDTGKFSYDYATLDHILDEVRPLLNKYGFALINTVENDGLALRVTLLHVAGDSVSSVMPLNKAADPKQYGSSLTYMRRYGTVMLLGLAIVDDDDDGQQATQGAKQRAVVAQVVAGPPRGGRPKGDTDTPGYVRAIWIQLANTQKALGWDRTDGEAHLRKMLNDLYGKESTKTLTAPEANEVIKRLHDLQTQNEPPEEE